MSLRQFVASYINVLFLLLVFKGLCLKRRICTLLYIIHLGNEYVRTLQCLLMFPYFSPFDLNSTPST